METLIFSFNAVISLILIVGLGYFLKRIKLIDNDFVGKANRFCFLVAFPLQLFYNIYHIDFNQPIDLNFLLFIVISILLMVVLLIFTVPKMIKDATKVGSFIQGAYRSNFLLIGLPLASNLFGENGVAIASLALPIVIPLYNFTAVIVLSLFAKGNTPVSVSKPPLLKLITEILKNPLIIASLLGLLMSLCALPVPMIFDKAIHDVGVIATPFALILLGGQFSFETLHGRLKLAIIASVLRVMIFPLFIITAAILLGFRNSELGTIMIIFATPSAISGFIMAKNMNNDSELAGQIIILTTLLSSLTLFAWVFVLKWIGFI
ncbi:MAG: AEC family transporter [Vallitaleaceae bacterium]|nr:AEC family transporter [Vallitaleaceae bacterium]